MSLSIWLGCEHVMQEVSSAVIAGDGTKRLLLSLDICSILLKTLSIHIQPQNVETWLSLKSIFNSRPGPSLAPAAAQDWPFTFTMLRPCLSLWPAGREELAGCSHTHTLTFEPQLPQDLFLDFQLPPDECTVHTLLTWTQSRYTNFISCSDPTHACYCPHTDTNIYTGLCLTTYPIKVLTVSPE